MLQTLARSLAIALGVAGVAAMLGILGATRGAGILYLFTAFIFAYAGFWNREAEVIRSLVGGMGTLYLLYGLIMAAVYLGGEEANESGEVLWSLANATFGGVIILLAGVLSSEDQRHRSDEGEHE